jgi:GxxExxY protein
MEQEEQKGRRFCDGSEEVIGALIEVHRVLGPGLLESVYEKCVSHELTLRSIRYARQVHVPVLYKGIPIDCGLRLDFLVEDRLIVELKSVEQLTPVHTAQVVSYLRITGVRGALLVNFNVCHLRDGLKRVYPNPKSF